MTNQRNPGTVSSFLRHHFRTSTLRPDDAADGQRTWTRAAPWITSLAP